MAIMVGGGLTFAIPGMEPAYAAQINSNPNLKVSAEGQNADNEITSTNIVEVVIIDDLTDTNTNRPPVTVNGEDFSNSMYFYSGAWYGYFADNDILTTGLAGDAAAVTDLVTTNPGNIGDSPVEFTVRLLDLDGDFDVVYQRPGADQTVSMTLDNPASGVSLDRANYPQNTDVVVTIDDMALNVDPTSEDTWYFATGGNPVHSTNKNVGNLELHAAAEIKRDAAYAATEAKYRNAVDNAEAIRDKAIAAALATLNEVKAAIASLPSLLTYADQASEQTRRDGIITTATSIYEGIAGSGLRNDNNTGENYKGTALLAYELANADVDTTDSPAFVRNAERITAGATYTTETDSTLPTSDDGVGGYFEAFSLNENGILECATTDCAVLGGVTWVKFTEDGSNESTFTNTSDDVASLKTATGAQRGLSFSITYDNTATSGIGFSTTNIVIDAGTEWNSGEEIAITLTDSDANTNSLTEDDLKVTNAEQIIPTIRVGEPYTLANAQSVTLVELDDNNNNAETDRTTITPDMTEISDILVLMGDGTYTGVAKLVIDLGKWSDVNDFLPAYEPSFKGTHMINYDLDSLNATSISLKIGSSNPYVLVSSVDADNRDTAILTGSDFIPGDRDTDPLNFGNLYDADGNIIESDAAASLEIGLDQGSGNTIFDTATMPAGTAIVIDFFSFGLEGQDNPNTASTVNNAIYRLELEEDGSNSSDFIGTLEYIGLNQINMYERSTYGGITTIDDNIILISDDDSISVEYRDLDSNGVEKTFTAGADTPTHSGSVSLSSDGYKVADTVLVTVEDADLNVDSVKADVYTGYDDKIDSANSVIELLSVSIDNYLWDDRCGDAYGLEATQFTLRETGNDSGIFTGTFSVPAEHCADSNSEATTVTGADISAEYVDFRDDSGSLITVSASAGIRSLTGSVSLDRTVYPVPFGADDPADNNDETFFGTHGDALPQGDLTVYVSINDADFDTSANGIDSIEVEGVAPLTVTVIRGSVDIPIATAGNTGNAISETARDSGIFEYELDISYDAGPPGDKCPVGLSGCILQGDILHVEYNDPSDASGSDNTVTDSATFDLRNGVLQSDQTAYIIGSEMIVTLIEPDLNLDSGSVETHTLDLIEWDSDAGTENLRHSIFDATPSNLLETGEDTGIFQVVVGIPPEIDGDRLERGEEITLTYLDWGPSGSDFVGDKDEEITTTVYTSNFGATIELDQRVYTWTDKVYVTIVAPDHNIDSDQVDEIGNNDDYPIRVSTRGNEIDEYKLVETGADTGIFSGEITLIGFEHDADGDGNDDAGGQTSPDRSGPTDGQIGTESESGISVSFKYSEGETVSSSALIRWNVGEVQWLEASYPASGSGIVRVIDPDMNLNPEAVDNFDITVWSDSDRGGIDLTVTETNAATGIFEGTTFFGVGVDTSGHRLRVVEGDTVTAQYYDNTLPAPFKETERVRVGATTLIGTVVPPLERAPITDLRAVDSFGNTLDVISVDSQIQLAADVTNNQDKAQEFAYLIQIQNEGGVTVSLDWIAGSLTAGQSLSPASSWTPDEAGTYEVTAFVWESIENPTALSPTSTITITVN